jgi:hypothetical protein
MLRAAPHKFIPNLEVLECTLGTVFSSFDREKKSKDETVQVLFCMYSDRTVGQTLLKASVLLIQVSKISTTCELRNTRSNLMQQHQIFSGNWRYSM